MIAAIGRLLRRLVNALRPDRAEADLAREVAAHLALIEDEYRRRGLSATEARRQARLSLDVEQARHGHRDARSVVWLDELWTDVRYAIRSLVRHRRFSLGAILILSTTGATAALTLGIADVMLFRPLPYRDADRVMVVRMLHETSGRTATLVSNRVLQRFAEPGQGLSAAGLLDRGPRITVDAPDGPSGIVTAGVTPGYFQVLGVEPLRGRLFQEHDVDTGRFVTLLAHETWVSRFAGSEDIVGRTVALGDTTLDIVGILPQGLFLPTMFGEEPELYTAIRFPSTLDDDIGAFHPVVRLSDDVTHEEAQAALAVRARTGPSSGDSSLPVLEPVRSVLFPRGRIIMRWLVLCTAILVGLAAVNLAGLLIIRGVGRTRDVGVRLALGANRMRIVRPAVLEVVALGLLGSTVAVLAARTTFEALLAYVPRVAYSNAPVGIDLRVAVITVTLIVAASVSIALATTWLSMQRSVDVLVRVAGGDRSSQATWRRGRTFIAVQTALTVVLVFGAVVTGRAFVHLLNVPLGFDPRNVATLAIAPVPDRATYRRLVSMLGAVSGVVAAGAAGQMPFDGGGPDDGFAAGGPASAVGVTHALPGYLEALHVPILAGRSLLPIDIRSPATAIVVSESAARLVAPDAVVVGSTVAGRDGRTFQIVGIAADIRHRVDGNVQPTAYVIPADPIRRLSLVVRTTDQSGALLETVTALTRREVPGARVTVDWYADTIADTATYRNPRFQTIVLATLSSLALILTMVGLMGALGALVLARARELAIRAAVGATQDSLVRLVIVQGLTPVVAGLAIGLLATRWIGRFVEAQLFAIDASGTVPLAMTSFVVLAAALVAAWIPARRAGRSDPVVALRSE